MNKLFSDGNSTVSSDRVLYTASSFARSSLLHLQEIGNLKALRTHTSKREGLQSYLFFVVESGSGSLLYDDRKYELQPSSCVFIDCRKPYSHTTMIDDLWTLRWCHFFGPTMNSVYSKYCERGGRPVFTLASTDNITALLDELMNTSRSSTYMRDMLINEQLSTLIRLIMEQSWHPEDKVSAPKRQSVTDVRAYLDEHYAERITLDELSSLFFIDKYYMTKTFHSQFGVNISTYLQNLRITKAKQLLRFSSKTVEEIGSEVGMENPAYFSRVFKNIEGVSPSKYREQW